MEGRAARRLLGVKIVEYRYFCALPFLDCVQGTLNLGGGCNGRR